MHCIVVHAYAGALAEHVKLDSHTPPSNNTDRAFQASSPSPPETISANTAAAIIMEHLAPFSNKLSAATSCTGASEADGGSGVCTRDFGVAAKPAVEALTEAAGPKSVPKKQIVRTNGEGRHFAGDQ